MKIETISAFVAAAPEIQDLLDAAYVVTCYPVHVAVQACFSGDLVKRYLEQAKLHIKPGSGYVEGELILSNGVPIQITLTE